MKVFDLKFADGKACRCIVMEPMESEEDERASIGKVFHPGHLTGMTRVIAAAPTKLPWVRTAVNRWAIGLITLERLETVLFRCVWPGGEIEGNKAAVSDAVRENWARRE